MRQGHLGTVDLSSPHLPRGTLGDRSGAICPTGGAGLGGPRICCQPGRGLLVSVTAGIAAGFGLQLVEGGPGVGTLETRDQAGGL